MTTLAFNQPSFDISDRVICITGGGGFLGKAFVKAFVDAGARVAVVDQNLALAEESARDAGGTKQYTLSLEADIRDPAAVNMFTQQILQHWGVTT